ncbi:MAG: hypothetical protein JXB46_04675 [Candidatus Eisenbacteria bacterium]|nr:hypothetical protein [Candidatus Eisenbacteria bacterium]
MRRVRALATSVILAIAAMVLSCAEEQPDAAPSSPIRFYREYVTVEPATGSTRVSALYYFRNESDGDVHQMIRYPFPVDRFHLYPRVVRVWEKTDDDLRPMGFSHRDRSIVWTMSLGPRETKTVRVDYAQDIRSPRAIYIVTTTRLWQRPIELAEFEFRVPSSLDSVRLNFKPDLESASGDTVIYYVKRRDFMPDQDMIVTWKERK